MDLHKLVHENQTIKIVPPIEDSLTSTGLNVDLDSAALAWLAQLKSIWKTWKKSSAVEQSVESFLQCRPDPHRIALAIIIKCEDFKDCKPKTLPFNIIEILKSWSQKHEVYPEDSVKLPAFHVAIKQRNQTFLTLIVETYQIGSIKHAILPIVKEIIQESNYRQATRIVIAADLFNDIAVEDMMFPLILQDKTNFIDEYFTECPHQIKPFLLFLDKFLDRGFNIREYIQKYIEDHDVPEVKYEKLHYKPLGKLVGRLCNKFKIPIETCKNLSKNRTTGGLRYLIHQKYQENNVSSLVWDDLVKDSLKQNVESATEFINMLSEYDKKEAIKWAKYLNIPESEYPQCLVELPLQCNEEVLENWEIGSVSLDSDKKYYKLKIPPERVMIIDNGEAFYDMMTHLMRMKVVGLDCEWKPSFGATQSQVALIQLAVYDKVYLIDSLKLNSKSFSSFWHMFNKSLLENAEIIKIGFGLEQDLKEIKASVICLGNIKVKGEGLLDLSLLWKSLINSGLIIPLSSTNGGSSLTSLVEACFGLALEKTEQCSNWELRPLRSTQIDYAALDAHVLTDIYNYLERMCLQQRINFDEICNDIMLEGKQKGCKKPKVIERLQTSFTNNREVKLATELKFLVDPKLSQLLSYLRYCGINTTSMSNTMMWHDVIHVAADENRFILLSKMKYSPTPSFPQSKILEVSATSRNDQIRKIFDYFNIVLDQKYILSRCIYCNADNIKPLDQNALHDIYTEYLSQSRSCGQINASEDDDESAIDNFISDSDSDDCLYQPVTKKYTGIITTSKGVAIQCDDIEKVVTCNKPVFLCEMCGKFLWSQEDLILNVSSLIHNIAKLSLDC